MKSFNLEEALAGEPVKLRDGTKAYVKFNMPDDYDGDYPLRGFFKYRGEYVQSSWTITGRFQSHNITENEDIIGMWVEPRPRVQLDLPCPLKEPQEGMWYLHPQYIRKSSYSLENHDDWISINRIALENGSYFATKEDAEEWQQAIRNSRK